MIYPWYLHYWSSCAIEEKFGNILDYLNYFRVQKRACTIAVVGAERGYRVLATFRRGNADLIFILLIRFLINTYLTLEATAKLIRIDKIFDGLAASWHVLSGRHSEGHADDDFFIFRYF